MSPVAHIRKSVWRLGCWGCHCLNLLLTLSALFLGAAVTLNLLQKEIPVPDNLARWVIRQSGPEHLEAQWSRAYFDLRAGLYLSKFKLRNNETQQILLTAESAYLKWSPLHLLTPGYPILQEMRARNIEIYVPVTESPSGLNEPVLGIRHLAIEEHEGRLILSSLMLHTGGLRLHASGSAPMRQLTQSGSGAPGSTGPYAVLRALRRLPENLKADISLNWRMLPTGDHLFELTGFLPEYDYQHIHLNRLHASAQARLSKGQFTVRHFQTEGILSYQEDLPKIPALKLPRRPGPIPFTLSASGTPWKAGPVEIPAGIRLALHHGGKDLYFQHIVLSTDLSRATSPQFDWILQGPRTFLSGHAISRRSEDPASWLRFPTDFAFRAYLPDWSIYQYLPAPLPARQLIGTKAEFIRLNATFSTASLNLEGTAVVDDLNIGQTDFRHLATKVTINPKILFLDDIHVRKSADEAARGSYFQDFATTRFSLNAYGQCFPASLDNLLGDWWSNIFTNIRARRPLPADVTVWGQWRYPESLRSVTEVHGGGASYNGVEIPTLELRVRSNDNWAYLDHLVARFPDGEMKGKIAIQSGLAPTTPYRAYTLDLSSTAPWEAVVGASGVKGLEILQFDGSSPKVTAKGVLWRDSGKGFDSPEFARLELSLVHPNGTCRFQGMHLQGLDLLGHLQGDQLRFSSVSGRFAEGIFAGTIDVTGWQDPGTMVRVLDFNLLDAHYPTARKELSNLMDLQPDGAPDSASEDLSGRLDTSFLLHLEPDPGRNSGQGSVFIRDARLGSVHLFGTLSRVLGSLGMGFTTVDLDTLDMDWSVNGQALDIPKALITGPALNLRISGSMDIPTRQLNMRSEVNLFSGLFSKVLSPVSETVELDLRGTYDSPDWRISFNPFRWALNRMPAPAVGSPPED